MKRLGVTVLVVTLSACGGGGGTVPAGGGGSTPTPTPAPSASPGISATGRVVDYASGTPIAGAVVVAGASLVQGATPPPTVPAGDAQTMTGSDGSFSLPVPLGAGNLMVFASGYIALHAPETFSTGANTLGTLKVSTETADDAAWLAAINQDRATYGAAPVILDERLTEATRLWDAYEAANGRYGDSDPLAPVPYKNSISVYGSLGGYNIAVSQNGAGDSAASSGVDAEAAFRSEGPAGPHFSTIIFPSARWAGLARVQCQGVAGTTCPFPGVSYTLDVLVPPAGV
jgi:uncharacterized protein YkwD